MRIKELRLARGWSQEQLAERSGLSIRTIQRIERGGSPGLDTLGRLAVVFQVDVSTLQADEPQRPGDLSFVDAVTHCLRHYADFDGVARRSEFWWFALAFALAVAFGRELSDSVGAMVAIALLLPLLASATRRLRDAGQSPWWLLMGLVPVGGLVVIGYLLTLPSQDDPRVADEAAGATS